eukprot:COSAG04_NODE_7902_length_1048_cov_1.869336_1_plen_252_part_01
MRGQPQPQPRSKLPNGEVTQLFSRCAASEPQLHGVALLVSTSAEGLTEGEREGEGEGERDRAALERPERGQPVISLPLAAPSGMRPALLAVVAALAGSTLAGDPRTDCASIAEEDKPECWWLHGAGETCPDGPCPGPTSDPAMADGELYWGDFGGSNVPMACCKSRHFNHEETVHQTFDEPALRRSVCSQLCPPPGGKGCIIVDKVLFTHSAANLYLAAALDHGDCFLGSSSDWYAVNAPALGSAVASEGTR